jgi:hypothetical protein
VPHCLPLGHRDIHRHINRGELVHALLSVHLYVGLGRVPVVPRHVPMRWEREFCHIVTSGLYSRGPDFVNQLGRSLLGISGHGAISLKSTVPGTVGEGESCHSPRMFQSLESSSAIALTWLINSDSTYSEMVRRAISKTSPATVSSVNHSRSSTRVPMMRAFSSSIIANMRA